MRIYNDHASKLRLGISFKFRIKDQARDRSNKSTYRDKKNYPWFGYAENRMRYIGVGEDDKKVILLRSWGGSELVTFMKTHAKIDFEAIPATATALETPADTYAQTTKKTKDELRQLVNCTMAMHQLLTTKQGDCSWMNFKKDLEDKTHVLDFNQQPYKHNDVVKDAAIFAMTDLRLKEKALADDPNLSTLIR